MKGLAYERLCVVFCCLWGIPYFSGLRRPQIWGGPHPKFGTVVPMWFSKLGRTEKGGLSPYVEEVELGRNWSRDESVLFLENTIVHSVVFKARVMYEVLSWERHGLTVLIDYGLHL